MTRKNSWKWSIYPQLHGKVSSLLEESDLHFQFYDVDNDESCIKTYDTNVMGSTCNNRKCGTNGWLSKRITITIRMYEGARYNARVYSQYYKACNSPSRPHLDGNSIELAPPHYSGQFSGEHETDLYEGCKAGHYIRG
ncbi:hypothetical protein EDB81DRAFT_843387 [Dactylonectria macrodidyma]|uniref:3CxxC-type domain-containing protein n=1 Tax=Dactylonectria macrodidyma TaxID=307937 RepID=A0A9P9EQE0_9HYPO|nr:hypothetical protein EDB81DRAFT_843387 [Dactylonectria macrodidyma]